MVLTIGIGDKVLRELMLKKITKKSSSDSACANVQKIYMAAESNVTVRYCREFTPKKFHIPLLLYSTEDIAFNEIRNINSPNRARKMFT